MAKAIENAREGATMPSRIEPIIARYPDVDPSDLEYLLHWYRTEASAYDVGMLAANQEIQAGYERFRADHIDRLTPADFMKALGWIVLLGAIIFAIAYMAR